MAELGDVSIPIGALVEVPNGRGTVKFVGMTQFAAGIWVGIELESQTGKNNGTVQDIKYFECKEGHGVFVRPSLAKIVQKLPFQVPSSNFAASINTAPSSNGVPSINTVPLSNGVQSSNVEMDDLKMKLKILEKKRIEDREKLKEFERYKIESEQSKIARDKLMERINDLQSQVKDLRAKQSNQEDIEELKETIEILSLDKEMAEEKCELMRVEMEEAKLLAESFKMDLQLRSSNQADCSMDTSEILQQNLVLKEALIKLKELSLKDEVEKAKHIREIEAELIVLRNAKSENTQLKQDLMHSLATIEELKSSIDDSSGLPSIIESLTEKLLNLEEKISEQRTIIEDLEALKELSDELEASHLEAQRDLHNQIIERDNLLVSKEKEIFDLNSLVVEYQKSTEFLKATLQSRSNNETSTPVENSNFELVESLKFSIANMTNNLEQKSWNLKLAEMKAVALEKRLLIVQKFLAPQVSLNLLEAIEVFILSNCIAEKALLHLNANKSMALHKVVLFCKRIHFYMQKCSLEEFLKISTLKAYMVKIDERISSHADLHNHSSEIELFARQLESEVNQIRPDPILSSLLNLNGEQVDKIISILMNYPSLQIKEEIPIEKDEMDCWFNAQWNSLFLKSKEISETRDEAEALSKIIDEIRRESDLLQELHHKLSLALQEKTNMMSTMKSLQNTNEDLMLTIEMRDQKIIHFKKLEEQLKESEIEKKKLQVMIKTLEHTILELQLEIEEHQSQMRSLKNEGNLSGNSSNFQSDNLQVKVLKKMVQNLKTRQWITEHKVPDLSLPTVRKDGGKLEFLRKKYLELMNEYKYSMASCKIISLKEQKKSSFNNNYHLLESIKGIQIELQHYIRSQWQ